MSSHQGIFSRGLFDGAALGGSSDLGLVPAGPSGERLPIDQLQSFSSRFDTPFPSVRTLQSKGVTHFTAEGAPTSMLFTFYANGQLAQVAPFRAYRQSSEPVGPQPGDRTGPAFAEGDGLLPASTTAPQNGTPKWLPFALLGGGLLIAGGIVYASAKKPVRANRRRRRKKR